MSKRAGSFSFEIRTGLTGLDSLEEEWKALHRACGTPAFYTDWRWYRALVRHLLRDPVHFACARRDQALVAVLPLQLRGLERGPLNIPVLSFPNHDHIELADMVLGAEVPGPDLLPDLHDFLARTPDLTWQCLHLRGVREGAGLLSAMDGGPAEADRRGANAFFDTRDPDAVLVPRKLRHNIQRLKRRAEDAFGSVRVTSAFEGESLEAAFGAFLSVESSGWKGVDGTSTAILGHSNLVAFYRTLLTLFSEDRSARINLLWFGDQAVAGQFCLRAGGTWSLLKIGYREDRKDYGPGAILLNHLLEEARADAAVSEINLVTSPDWARRWSPSSRPVYAVTGFRDSMQGRALKVIHLALNRMQKRETDG